MNWIILFLAGIAEISWAIALKYAEGFTKLLPSVLVLTIGTVSLWLLSVAVKTIPLGTAYAVWTGIGILGTSVIGMLYFQEPITFLKLAFVACILIGIIGLRVSC